MKIDRCSLAANVNASCAVITFTITSFTRHCTAFKTNYCDDLLEIPRSQEKYNRKSKFSDFRLLQTLPNIIRRFYIVRIAPIMM